MRVALVWLLALVGCAQIFDLDAPTLTDTPSAVNGTFKLAWIENGVAGVVRNERAFTESEASAAVRLDDGSEHDVTLRADGSFTFATQYAEQPYALTLRTPYGVRRIEHTVANLDIVERLAGHLERKPAPANTTITLIINDRPLLASGEQVQTTGLWLNGAISPATDPAVIEWNALTSLSGPPGLLEANRHDALIYAAYVDNGEYVLMSDRSEEVVVDVIPGAVVTLSSRPVLRSSCAQLGLGLAAEQRRLADNAMGTFVSSREEWFVYASPANELGASVSHALAWGLTNNGSRNVVFGNPFDMPVFALARVSRSRVVDGAVLEVATVSYVSLADATCGVGVALPALEVAIPRNIRLAGTDITNDSTIVALAGTDPIATWDISTGRVDQYVVILREIENGKLVNRFSSIGITPELSIARDALLAGHTYSLLVLAIASTNAASGDFRSVMFPSARGLASSGTFKVQ